MTNTNNINLKKPGKDDFFNVDTWNENMDKIDTAVGDQQQLQTEAKSSIVSAINENYNKNLEAQKQADYASKVYDATVVNNVIQVNTDGAYKLEAGKVVKFKLSEDATGVEGIKIDSYIVTQIQGDKRVIKTDFSNGFHAVVLQNDGENSFFLYAPSGSGGIKLQTDVRMTTTPCKGLLGIDYLNGVKPRINCVEGFGRDSNNDGVADDWSAIKVATSSLSNLVQSFIPNEKYGRIQSDKYSVNHSDKYYVRSFVKTTSNTCAMYLRYFDSVNSLITTVSVPIAKASKYTEFSLIGCAESYNNAVSFDVIIQENGQSDYVQVDIMEFLVENLTERYGFGKEPNLEWCDNNLTYIEGISLCAERGSLSAESYNKFNGSLTYGESYNDLGINHQANEYSRNSVQYIPISLKASSIFISNDSGELRTLAYWYDADRNYISVTDMISDNALHSKPDNARYYNFAINTTDTGVKVWVSEDSKIPYIEYVCSNSEYSVPVKYPLVELPDGTMNNIERGYMKCRAVKVDFDGNEEFAEYIVDLPNLDESKYMIIQLTSSFINKHNLSCTNKAEGYMYIGSKSFTDVGNGYHGLNGAYQFSVDGTNGDNAILMTVPKADFPNINEFIHYVRYSNIAFILYKVNNPMTLCNGELGFFAPNPINTIEKGVLKQNIFTSNSLYPVVKGEIYPLNLPVNKNIENCTSFIKNIHNVNDVLLPIVDEGDYVYFLKDMEIESDHPGSTTYYSPYSSSSGISPLGNTQVNEMVGQSFTFPEKVKLEKIRIALCSGSTYSSYKPIGNARCSIYNCRNGKPTTLIEHSKTEIKGSSLSSSLSTKDFNFDEGIVLEPNVEYAVVISNTGPIDSERYFNVAVYDSSVRPERFISYNGTVWNVAESSKELCLGLWYKNYKKKFPKFQSVSSVEELKINKRTPLYAKEIDTYFGFITRNPIKLPKAPFSGGYQTKSFSGAIQGTVDGEVNVSQSFTQPCPFKPKQVVAYGYMYAIDDSYSKNKYQFLTYNVNVGVGDIMGRSSMRIESTAGISWTEYIQLGISFSWNEDTKEITYNLGATSNNMGRPHTYQLGNVKAFTW